MVVTHGLSCPVACEIFPDQGLDPRPQHWQAYSLSPGPPGKSPANIFIWVQWKTHLDIQQPELWDNELVLFQATKYVVKILY